MLYLRSRGRTHAIKHHVLQSTIYMLGIMRRSTKSEPYDESSTVFLPAHVVILSEAKNLMFKVDSDPSLRLRVTGSLTIASCRETQLYGVLPLRHGSNNAITGFQ